MKALDKIFFLALLLFQYQSSSGQVWPGDVNNNGVVNNIDFLFMGEAYAAFGPARLPAEQGIEWEEKNIDATWPQTLSNGVNAAFADCDGNGFVGFFDDIAAISFNYLNEQPGGVTPDVFTAGNPGSAPPLFFNTIETTLPEIFEGGFAFGIISLGTPTQIIEDWRGIAFSLEYDESLFNDALLGLDFEGGSWLGDPDDLEIFIQKVPGEGRMDVAIIRRDATSPSGSGEIGQLLIVIEDNVMDLSTPEIETTFKFTDVRMVTESSEDEAVFPDSTSIIIKNDDGIFNSTSDLKEKEIRIYPQPAHDQLLVDHLNTRVELVEIFDLTGRKLKSNENKSQQVETAISVNDLPSGPYLLKVLTEKGWLVEKILIQQ